MGGSPTGSRKTNNRVGRPWRQPRPLLVSDQLVAHPVEGQQVVARQVEARLAAQGARVIAGSSTTVPDDADWTAAYSLGWFPLRMLAHAMAERPSTVVFQVGLGYRTLLHAVLLAVVTMRRVRLVALQLHPRFLRRFPRPVGLIVGRFFTAVAGNQSDCAALRRRGVQAELFVPSVDPDRISTLERSQARQLLGLPNRPTYLHVGHAKHGRNLHAFAPLVQQGDGQLVLIISPYHDPEPGSYPEGEHVRLVQRRVDVGAYYRAADVYVFAVVRADSVIAHPLSIDEALANGLPVVARRSPMTQYWEGHPRVTLTDSDEELVTAARTVMAHQLETVPV